MAGQAPPNWGMPGSQPAPASFPGAQTSPARPGAPHMSGPGAIPAGAPGSLPMGQFRPPLGAQAPQGYPPGGMPPHGMMQAGGMYPPQAMWRPPLGAAAPAAGGMPGAARPAAGAPGPGAAPGGSAPAVKCDWSEHTAPDGRKYYYNTVTKTSVWQKPKALADAEAEAMAAKVLADCPWKEHKAPDGRSYFHNRSLSKSVWKVPDELAAARREAARLRSTITGGATPSAQQSPAAAPAAAGGPGAAPAAAKPGAAPAAAGAPAAGAGGEFMYATKDEAKAAFKAMLTALQAPIDAKWDKIAARMEAARDPRFHALKSNGERASCYKDWIADQKAASAKAAEEAAERRRDAFVEMLLSKAALLAGARYSKVEALFYDDPRFEALPEPQRQAVFTDWQSERRRAAEAEERATTELRMKEFRAMLEQRAGSGEGGVTAAASWGAVERALADEPAFQACPPPARLRVWLQVLKELVDAEHAAWDAEDRSRHRKERKHRDAFCSMLRKHREQGLLQPRTKWRRYRDIIRKDPEYLCMETNLAGSRPRELFSDIMTELEEAFFKDKVKVKAALRAAGVTVEADTEWSDFLAALEAPDIQERLQGVADTSLRLCHQEMLERAREKEAREKERRSGGGGGGAGGGSETRRAMKHELARKMKRVSEFVRPDMQWPEARRLMLEHGVALLSDMDPRDAEQVWDEWVARQNAKKHKRDRRDRDRDRRSDHHHREKDSRSGAERDHHRDGESRKRRARSGTADGGDGDGGGGDGRSVGRSPASGADAAAAGDTKRQRQDASLQPSPRGEGVGEERWDGGAGAAGGLADAEMRDAGNRDAAAPAAQEVRRGEGMDVEEGEV
eukprot:jgi/Ulvmu1/2382/UM130_0015.1